MKHLKQEFDKLTFKEVIIYILAIVVMIAGLSLLFIGLFIPPEGEIHSSVLTAFGTVCIFVASLLGISILSLIHISEPTLSLIHISEPTRP